MCVCACDQGGTVVTHTCDQSEVYELAALGSATRVVLRNNFKYLSIASFFGTVGCASQLGFHHVRSTSKVRVVLTRRFLDEC